MALVHAVREAMGSRRDVLGPCLSLEGRQASLRVTLKLAPQLECTLIRVLCTSYMEFISAS